MSLVSKIFAAFVVMIGIAVCAGVMGWNTVQRMDETLSRIVRYEIIAEKNLSYVEQASQALTVAQRTLLNTDIAGEDREGQHATMLAEKDGILSALAELDGVFAKGSAEVTGWAGIAAGWQELRPGLEKWMQAVDRNDAVIREYESTAILAPDVLLTALQGYRGDHFQTTALMGEMLAKEESIGPKLNPADNLCGFGKWRERFESGAEPYSGNKVIGDAIREMAGPHKIFHATAPKLQELIGLGYENNPDEIDQLFVTLVEAARSVIGQFQTIGAEVERSRGLLRQATDFTMGPMREMRQSSIDALNALVDANTANMDKNAGAAMTEARNGVRTMQILATAALGLGLVVMVWLFFAIRRGLSRPLSRIIAVLSSDSAKVSAEASDVQETSASLSEGATSQASALEETSAAVEQITAMARRNLEGTKNASSEMHAASKQINESAQDMELMASAMEEIKDSSEKISNILRTIEEIAFQTNLLALNAAVEAARAGEAGKGFAVVADEVRNLAGRSAQAVKDTSELITGTVSRINNGDAITRRIKEHFTVITASAGRVTKHIEEIDGATSEQTLGMEQINQAVSQLDQVNQKTAANAETNAGASGTLNELSGNLQDQIDELSGMLKKIIGSRSVSAAPVERKPKQLPDKKRKQLALPAPRN